MPAAAGTPGYESEAWSLETFGCTCVPPRHPLDSGPVSGYGACFSAGITMALRRPHKRMKMG